MKRKKNKKIKLISICWLITTKCNYNCNFCFKQSGKRELYYNEAEKILKKIAQAGVKKISFSGGEPLLWTGIIDLIKKAKSLGLTTMLITNGSLLTKRKIKSLEKSLDWLTLPLDGSTEQQQQIVGRPKGHFSRILKFLKFLKKRKKIKVKINTVLCSKNLNNIDKLAELIKRNNIRRWKIFEFFPVRDKALQYKDDYSIKNSDFKRAKKRILPLLKNSSCSVYFGSKDLLEKAYFIIAPDGTVYSTKNDNDYLLGNLKTESLEKIWERNKIIDKEKYWERTKWILKQKKK